jgi:hypothetical protein
MLNKVAVIACFIKAVQQLVDVKYLLESKLQLKAGVQLMQPKLKQI